MIITDLVKSKKFYINLAAASVLLIVLFLATTFAIDAYTDNGNEIEVPNIIDLSVNEAKIKADSITLKIEVIDSVYAKHIAKGAIVEQIPKAKSMIKENRTIFVTINSFSDEIIPMPDLVGISIRQAITDAGSFGIKIGERLYVPDIAKDYVLKQIYRGIEIKPGTKIPKGSYIDLEIGQGSSSESVRVPNILGLKLKMAESTCDNLFLNISGKFYNTDVKTKEDTANAVIYKQSPMPINNNKTVIGSFIDVWLSTDKSLVPNIKADTLNTNDIETDEEDIL